MATQTVNEYKIYCDTEATYVSGWGTAEPTVCYNNNAHTVNASSVQLVQTVNSNAISIIEDKISITRNTRIISIEILDVAPGTTSVVYYTFPIPMSMYLFEYSSDNTVIGNKLSISANPDTVVGLIGADIAIGDTMFIAPAGLLLYGAVGFCITLTDGTNSNHLGHIISIDKLTGEVVMQNATTHAFLAINTLVMMTIEVLNNFPIGPPGIHKYAEKIIGGAAIPKDTITKYTFSNNAVSGPISLFVNLTCLY